MGVEDAIDTIPADHYARQMAGPELAPEPSGEPRMATPAAPQQGVPQTGVFRKENAGQPADEAIAAAKKVAEACETVQALEAAVSTFDGCALKQGCKNTVFMDGTIGADLLVIGEAPGRDEDRLGKPFVGRAGQLLDRMLAAIGRSREENTLISNVIFWRPPGNRTPTAIETSICRPFVDRLIDLTAPKAVILAGGAPMQALLGISGIMRSRGTWREIETKNGTWPALPIYHPAFLLRQPAQKRLAWTDLQNLAERLKED